MDSKLPTLLPQKVSAPTSYVAWLQKSQSEAALGKRRTGDPELQKSILKRRVIADIDTLADLNPTMAMRAKKSNHEETRSSLSRTQNRWPRSSSTSGLEKAVVPKKLDPLPVDTSTKKSKGHGPSSTSAVEKAVGRKKLDPLEMEPKTKKSNDEEVCSSLSRSQKRPATSIVKQMKPLAEPTSNDQKPFAEATRNPMMKNKFLASSPDDGFADSTERKERKASNKRSSQIKKQPLSDSAEDVRRLQEELLAQTDRISHSKFLSHGEKNTETSQLEEKSPPRKAKVEIKIEEPNPTSTFGALGDFCRKARDLNCPLDTTKDARSLFDRYATYDEMQQIMYLNYQKFGEIVVHILKSTRQELSEHGMKEKIQMSWREADRNKNGQVDFDEFAIWYSSWGFQQELLLSPSKIRCRDFAKEYDLNIADVESVQAKFCHFDEDGSGLIEFREFEKLLYKLMKIPRGQELPANRLKHFWKEIDIDGSGSVDFDEFLQWYIKYFDMKGNSDVSPIEQLYQSVRPNFGRTM